MARLLTRVSRNNLTAGTPPSILSSRCILAVLSPPEDWNVDGPLDLFERLSVTKSVAQKVQESIADDRPSVTRPAREARELLKQHGWA